MSTQPAKLSASSHHSIWLAKRTEKNMSWVFSRFNNSMSSLLIAATLLAASTTNAAEPQPPSVRQLSEFGDVTPKQVTETFHAAIADLRKSGGVLSMSAAEWKQLQNKLVPLQGLTRTPEPPSETKRWA